MNPELRDELIVRTIVFGGILGMWYIAPFEGFVMIMLVLIYDRAAFGGVDDE